MSRLHPSILDDLPIGAPAYDRSQPAGIAHLGTGAFHRAHQAAYFDALMAAGERGWMIRGASLRSPRVAAQLNPQGGLFTLVERDGKDERRRVIGAIRDVLVGPGDPGAVVAALAHPDTALVTLTITEKGYLLDPQTGHPEAENPLLEQDLARPEQPLTAPGLLVAGLAARRRAGLPPFTVLSCDNLPENGVRTRSAVLGFARRLDPGLADWIEAEAAFPSSMVDRIVPASLPEDIENLQGLTGYRDEAMVKTEPFSQWVIENRFCHRRPPLERVGVQFTEDVAGWETAKLRLLNGAHSALAYLGGLAGYRYVHEVLAAPGFAGLVARLWDEAEASLDPPDGLEVAVYRRKLLERFGNSTLEHSLVQIAMDGSQKLPQRLLESLYAARAQGRPAQPALTLAVAGWIRWQFSEDEAGRPVTVDDPLAERTWAAVRAGGGDPAEIVKNVVSLETVFGPHAVDDQGLTGPLTDALRTLMTQGAAAAVADLADG